MKMYCEKHPNQALYRSVKLYCPICEGYFSGHSLPIMKQCPFKFKMLREYVKDKGRAFPLVKGKVSHFIAEQFNRSLKYINNTKFETTVMKIFHSFVSFMDYMSLFIKKEILKTVENEIFSFYLFKKDIVESLYSEEKIHNIIPIVTEEWLSIPFNKKQYEAAIETNVKNWTKIGIHNILDEVFLDHDNRAICIDYKSYPRKSSSTISEIRSVEKKYQLITAMLTFEYNYDIDVKFVANVELGSDEFPNVSYYKPTDRGILYYKKALLQGYKNIFSNNYPPKYNEFTCLNFCEYKDICPHPEVKKFRKFLSKYYT